MATITYEQAQALSTNAAKVFQPRSPITTKNLFAGRWNQLTTVADAVHQIGLHAVIYGERGVGKTSLSNIVSPSIWALDGGTEQTNPRLIVKTIAASGDTFSSLWTKLFNEITWQDDKPGMGLLPSKRPQSTLLQAYNLQGLLDVNTVRRVLAQLPRSVFIIDEFDRSANKTSQEFSDLIKALSDFTIDSTIVLVGVADTIDKLVADHASIARAVIQIQLPRMEADELRLILSYGEQSLGVKFAIPAADLIVKMSQGLPHYTHLIGLNAVRQAALERCDTDINLQDVFSALKQSVKHAEQSITSKYSKATHSAQTDALYRQVLLACAIAATKSQDVLGYFNPAAMISPVSAILKKPVAIANFANHLNEFINEKRGFVLEREGQSRSYRYRFQDPLLVPFVFMKSVTNGFITDDDLLKSLT